MIDSDLEYFDPLSEAFQQSIQLTEYASLANSYNSTPKFYNINLTLDILDANNQNDLNQNDPTPHEVDLTAINLKIDPRSKSGNHHNNIRPFNMKAENPRLINNFNSPTTKKPFRFTVYKDNNENDKVSVTKMGRFSIIKSCHNNDLNNRDLNGNIFHEPQTNQQQRKTDISLQNDLILIC